MKFSELNDPSQGASNKSNDPGIKQDPAPSSSPSPALNLSRREHPPAEKPTLVEEAVGRVENVKVVLELVGFFALVTFIMFLILRWAQERWNFG